MKWIESAGGLLAAICESQASLWSASREEYTDACSVNDVGVITTSGDGGGPADVLVVCGEPLATSFSDELQLIVQWRCSENEELLMDLVHGNVRDLEWNPGGSFESKGRLVLFDAASPLRELSNVDYLEFVWPEGVGVVRAAEISVGDSAARVVGFSLGESL